MTTMTTTSNFGDAIPVQRHSFWRDCHATTPVRDEGRCAIDVGQKRMDTRHQKRSGDESQTRGSSLLPRSRRGMMVQRARCSYAPVLSTFEVVAAYVYRAGFDVAVAGVCCSRWSGAKRAFFHDFDDILERRSMSFVLRLVAAEGRWSRADSVRCRHRGAGTVGGSVAQFTALTLVVCRPVTKDTVKSSQPEKQSPKMS